MADVDWTDIEGPEITDGLLCPHTTIAGGDASRQRGRPRVQAAPLEGDRTGQWSVRASGNWRVVFRFEGGEAVDVDLADCH